MGKTYMGVNWQYVHNLNEINEGIESPDDDYDWEGLKDANDIISITYDSNHGCYVVFWKCPVES